MGFGWLCYYDDVVLIDWYGCIYDWCSDVNWWCDLCWVFEDYLDSYGYRDEYCLCCSDGVVGVVIGGVVGGIVGNIIGGDGNCLVGMLIGGGVGVLVG